jgi:hypothetical protein
MTRQERADLWDTFETYPTSKESFFFLVNFHFYWHDQDLFITKLKQLDIDIESARSYYSKLKKSIDQNPEFIRHWCRYSGLGNQKYIAPGSFLYDEITELEKLIHSIIKN